MVRVYADYNWEEPHKSIDLFIGYGIVLSEVESAGEFPPRRGMYAQHSQKQETFPVASKTRDAHRTMCMCVCVCVWAIMMMNMR
jgi:hypothetical protein